MRFRSTILISLCLSAPVLAVPAATAATAPQVTDKCGDATSRAQFNDQGTTIEENAPFRDIRSGGISGLYRNDGSLKGVQGSLEVCGQASATDGTYLLSWSYGGTCYGSLLWGGAVSRATEETGVQGHIKMGDADPAGVLSERCYHESTSLLDDGVDTVYEVDLPAEAVAFNGDTVSFSILTNDLPPAAAARFAPGVEWGNLVAVAAAQDAWTWAGYFDTEGNQGDVIVRVDFAFGGGSYVVGEDAPPK